MLCTRCSKLAAAGSLGSRGRPAVLIERRQPFCCPRRTMKNKEQQQKMCGRPPSDDDDGREQPLPRKTEKHSVPEQGWSPGRRVNAAGCLREVLRPARGGQDRGWLPPLLPCLFRCWPAHSLQVTYPLPAHDGPPVRGLYHAAPAAAFPAGGGGQGSEGSRSMKRQRGMWWGDQARRTAAPRTASSALHGELLGPLPGHLEIPVPDTREREDKVQKSKTALRSCEPGARLSKLCRARGAGERCTESGCPTRARCTDALAALSRC